MRLAREQARGMAVFPHAEQHQIEGQRMAYDALVLHSCRLGTAFGSNPVYLPTGHLHAIQPGARNHDTVTFGIIARQTTLVAEIDMPLRPFGVLFRQRLIGFPWRAAAGEHDAKCTALCDCGAGRVQNSSDRLRGNGLAIGKPVPADLPAHFCAFILSTQAIPMADSTKVKWIMTYHMSLSLGVC